MRYARKKRVRLQERRAAWEKMTAKDYPTKPYNWSGYKKPGSFNK